MLAGAETRAHCRMEPGHREEYIAYLQSKEQWGQAAQELAHLVNDDSFRSIEGKSKHHLWLELCDIITKHPDEVRALNIDAIIRAGIRKFPTEVSDLALFRALALVTGQSVSHLPIASVFGRQPCSWSPSLMSTPLSCVSRKQGRCV
jgi:hypothetical protein